MLKFEWNALRIGDRVLVHDPGTALGKLTPGVVALVDTHRGLNGVGIRMVTAGAERVVWPAARTVHIAPADRAESCWRCRPGTARP